MIKLVATDLDGTLLQKGQTSPDPSVFELIKRLKKEKGIVFVSASGRQYTSQQKLFAPVKDDIIYICENGCLAFCDGNRLHMELMPEDLAHEIMHDILRRDGEELLLSGMRTSYLKPKDPVFITHVQEFVKNNVTLPEDIFNAGEPYFKIATLVTGNFEEHLEYYQNKYGDRATVVGAGNNWIDFMPCGVTKKTSLEHLTKYLNISPSECMAFGDNYNDMEMLQYVGYPVAVNNAVPDVYEYCTRHTDTVENVLRQLLDDTFE